MVMAMAMAMAMEMDENTFCVRCACRNWNFFVKMKMPTLKKERFCYNFVGDNIFNVLAVVFSNGNEGRKEERWERKKLLQTDKIPNLNLFLSSNTNFMIEYGDGDS